MTEDRPLLSLCIPTRNRAAFLYRLLHSVASCPVFQNTRDVEIVVSDNASEDATRQIVDMFREKYGDKIVYSRNDEDLHDKNFEKALRLGSGRFLKLHNDTFWIADGQLDELLADIKKYEKEHPILFFTNKKDNTETVCSSLDDFIDKSSFNMTWLGGFGIWKEDLDRLENFGRHPEKHLTQVEVLLSEFSRKQKAVVFGKRYFHYQYLWNKPKGDIATVFGKNYADILNEYREKRSLSESVFKTERKRVLNGYILPFSFSLELAGEPDGLVRRLLPYYGKEPYFYAAFCSAFSRYFYKKTKQRVKKLFLGDDTLFKKEWKKFNKFSLTVPVKVDCPNCVYVGKNSSGDLIVNGEQEERDTLIIGENVKIGHDVRFVFNETGNLIFVKDGTSVPDGTVFYPDKNPVG